MPGRLDSKGAIVTDAGCVGLGWGNGGAAVTACVGPGAIGLARAPTIEAIEACR